jgi:hypothetical protein
VLITVAALYSDSSEPVTSSWLSTFMAVTLVCVLIF